MAFNIFDYLFSEFYPEINGYNDHDSHNTTIQMILLGFIPVLNIVALIATIHDLFFNNEEEEEEDNNDIWGKQF